MTLRPFSVVHSIIYDEKKGKATGVKIIDGNTQEMIEFYANLIFVNASALNSNAISFPATAPTAPVAAPITLEHTIVARVQIDTAVKVYMAKHGNMAGAKRI